MANTNCLEYRRCPDCGQSDVFQVVATSVFTLMDDGTDGYTDVEFDESSPAYCKVCDWSGNWGDLDEREAPLKGAIVKGLVLNVPMFFEDPEFLDWLNSEESIMTWHKRPWPATEWSDTVVLVDPHLNGEGADSAMPEHCWKRIVQACRHAGLGGQGEHIPVRLTNLAEADV